MAKKTIKKRWVKIITEKAFNEAELGETYIANPKDTLGRKLKTSISALGVDTRQNINIYFELSDVMGDKLVAKVSGYRIMPSSVKRMVRRMRNKLEDSFIAISKDGMRVRLKPILVTRFKTTGVVKKQLRASVRNNLALIVQKNKFTDLMKEIVAHRVQKQLFDGLKKVFPLSVCELKWVVKLSEGKAVEEDEVVVEEEQKKPAPAKVAVEKPAAEA